MTTVKLYAVGGEFVAEVPNLPWVHPPELLVWGSRFFVWKEQHKQYREVAGSFWLIAADPTRWKEPQA